LIKIGFMGFGRMARGLSGLIPMSLWSKQGGILGDLSGVGILFWFLAHVFYLSRSVARRAVVPNLVREGCPPKEV
jgi:hypothetical protein